MDIWWIVGILFVLAAIVVVSVVLRNSRQGASVEQQTSTTERDFVEERETSRLGNMSEEDQAWQRASLDKDRANRDEPPPAA